MTNWILLYCPHIVFSTKAFFWPRGEISNLRTNPYLRLLHKVEVTNGGYVILSLPLLHYCKVLRILFCLSGKQDAATR